MKRRFAQAGILFVVVFAAAQLIRPERANPPTDRSHTFQAQAGTSSGVVAVLDRSCGDCHSNNTEWRWYSKVAPLSWVMASSVTEGRKAVNFSEWSAYSPQTQRMLLTASCEDMSAGKMPGPYTLLRPDTRLSAQDIEAVCAAARQAEANAVAGR